MMPDLNVIILQLIRCSVSNLVLIWHLHLRASYRWLIRQHLREWEEGTLIYCSFQWVPVQAIPSTYQTGFFGPTTVVPVVTSEFCSLISLQNEISLLDVRSD